MSERIPEPEAIEKNCVIIFLQSLYGRRFDSLSEEELSRLQAAYLDKNWSGTIFRCSVDGCNSTFGMRLINGELRPGSMIFRMEGNSSPCLYEQED